MTAFVVAAFRTPVMPRGGAFAGLSLHDLAAPLVSACLTRAGVAPDEISELILSNALGAGGTLPALWRWRPDCRSGWRG